ncbi:hypothetical protein HAX54_038473 [Datura stramonium]|uniref:Uncharacterized protein n=1 Tax=Datura stramonium TaxID=4076 RepID=A0ABS8VM77_DATST|nr:hypothetical protein [Datura stramonium]
MDAYSLVLILYETTSLPSLFQGELPKVPCSSSSRNATLDLQAKQSTECFSSCRMKIERICDHKREKMDKNKKRTINDKEKGKGIEDCFEHSPLKNFKETDSERHEKMIQGINNLKSDWLRRLMSCNQRLV